MRAQSQGPTVLRRPRRLAFRGGMKKPDPNNTGLNRCSRLGVFIFIQQAATRDYRVTIHTIWPSALMLHIYIPALSCTPFGAGICFSHIGARTAGGLFWLNGYKKINIQNYSTDKLHAVDHPS